MSSGLTTALPAARSYGPRANALFARAKDARLPVAGGIELTHRCNLACTHCYVNLPAADRAAQRREMTTAQILRLIDEIAEAGTLYLTLTGGEPLVRADFEEIYRHAHGKGFVLTIYTNGTLLTDKVVALFAELPPLGGLEITQYGATEDTYDRVARAGAGQYRRFYQGVERARAAGVVVAMKTMAMRSNAHELPQMRAFAAERGMRFRFDAIISPRIDGGLGPLAERLSPEEVARIELTDDVRDTEFAEYCRLNEGLRPADDALYQCGAGLASFTIDPYGFLHPCELSRRLGWNAVDKGFAPGWYEAMPALRAKKRTAADASGCGSCGAAGLCTNCVGMAELEGRDFSHGNPYLCRVSDSRGDTLFGEERPRPNGLVKLRLRTTTPPPGQAAAPPQAAGAELHPNP
jgi:radical SAM protein with 4Fe4S-binding SPASM domain